MGGKGRWGMRGEQLGCCFRSRWEGIRAGTGVIAEEMVKREEKRKQVFSVKLGRGLYSREPWVSEDGPLIGGFLLQLPDHWEKAVITVQRPGKIPTSSRCGNTVPDDDNQVVSLSPGSRSV